MPFGDIHGTEAVEQMVPHSLTCPLDKSIGTLPFIPTFNIPLHLSTTPFYITIFVDVQLPIVVDMETRASIDRCVVLDPHSCTDFVQIWKRHGGDSLEWLFGSVMVAWSVVIVVVMVVSKVVVGLVVEEGDCGASWVLWRVVLSEGVQ